MARNNQNKTDINDLTGIALGTASRVANRINPENKLVSHENFFEAYRKELDIKKEGKELPLETKTDFYSNLRQRIKHGETTPLAEFQETLVNLAYDLTH